MSECTIEERNEQHDDIEVSGVDDADRKRKESQNERKRKQRAKEKAASAAGKKMAISQTVVDKFEADAILRQERGIRSAHIRKTIYRLAQDAAEYLGLPGPNYHLIRYGYGATKQATDDPTFVPPETDPVDDPDGSPEGELLTNRELFAMFDMESWNKNFLASLRPTKEESARNGELVVDALVGKHPGCITPEHAENLKAVGRAIQDAIEQGYKFTSVEQLWMDCAIRAEFDRLGPAEEARIRALPENERADVVATLPLVQQVIKQFDLE